MPIEEWTAFVATPKLHNRHNYTDKCQPAQGQPLNSETTTHGKIYTH
jgi:hypothetical protein